MPVTPGAKVASKVFDWPRSTVVSVVKVAVWANLDTTAVPADDAKAELLPSVTVIVTEIEFPISAEVNVYVELVAPVIALPARRH